jgi:hypothetical protein
MAQWIATVMPGIEDKGIPSIRAGSGASNSGRFGSSFNLLHDKPAPVAIF